MFLYKSQLQCFKFHSLTAITVIWDECTGETTVFSPAIPQAPFTTFYSDGIVLRMLLPQRPMCLFSCSPFPSAVARAVFSMLDYVASAIKSTQKLLCFAPYNVWSTVYHLKSFLHSTPQYTEPSSICIQSCIYCYLRWLRRYHSMFSSLIQINNPKRKAYSILYTSYIIVQYSTSL